jgi:predicted enzyme related to lactoylglutathione lyase
MAKVTGIGGVFVKARDPKALMAWYADVLGFKIDPWGGSQLENEAKTVGVWNAFAADTKYFEPSDKPFMINFRVDDLDGLLAQVREKGGQVLDRREDSAEIGKFGYVVDPEGTLLELWQPPALL